MLGKIRRIVTFFHKSSTAAELLKQKRRMLALPDHKLIQDVTTRWNSSYDMVQRYLELQAAVYAALLSLKKDKDMSALTDTEISDAEQFVTIMKPLKDATTVMCDEKVPTISVLLPLYEKILSNFQPADEDSSMITDIKRIAVKDLKDRYSGVMDTLRKATVIDPRFKSMPFLTEADQVSTYTEVTLDAASVSKQVPW